MIARFLILLPFDLFITDDELWTSVEGTAADYRFKIYPPAHWVERLDPTQSVHAHVSFWAAKLNPPSFSENLLLNGRRIGRVNVLRADFIKPEFDRLRGLPPDKADAPQKLAFDLANEVLARIRVCTRAPQITPLLISRDPWHLQYLTNDGAELPEDKEKIRITMAAVVTVGVVALTPESMRLVVDRWNSDEPYVWDQLLLDAHELWPEVGSSIVIAFAALETFIAWALEILQQEQQKFPERFWKWIKDRDHWSKQPAVAEQYDALLFGLTGRSLKEEEKLWTSFRHLKKARNTLVHEGTANIGGKLVDATEAKLLIDGADKIVAWVESLLPERHRRARTEAEGPFARRMATPAEAASLGFARIGEGQPGALAPGASIRFDFQGQDPETKVGD